MFEIIIIILTITVFIMILYTPIFRILNLNFYTYIFITAFPCGILPISILEILFYFEKKRTNLKLDLPSQTAKRLILKKYATRYF